ncbi:protein of unknown function [Methylotuvimicrobium alcaliphilum 20Z]|uniref:Uncharacterized protein n=1 Tax=Methylotuvimicrobium alcaliphilum (strain DSM 19304 / NCIMB 14124 / VKM B-2133 / 20Z) TaxID=1091494 RepID=G4SX57_META2|nr:protein of unknown function [Methylotuvimicrobium alcaliphilum 20Z]
MRRIYLNNHPIPHIFQRGELNIYKLDTTILLRISLFVIEHNIPNLRFAEHM